MRDVGPEDKFEYILRYGKHTMDPDVAESMFTPTDAEPGSQEKIEIMAKRFSLGQPIFHPKDRSDYIGGSLEALGRTKK